jgi:hypothetical protein
MNTNLSVIELFLVFCATQVDSTPIGLSYKIQACSSYAGMNRSLTWCKGTV